VEVAKYKDRAGEVIYNLYGHTSPAWAFSPISIQKTNLFLILRYLKGLASNIETYVKDEIQKESLVEAFAAKHVISFALQTEAPQGRSPYVYLENCDGTLTVNIVKGKICCNCFDTGKDLARACSDDGPMTVLARKNIKDKEADLKKHLARIQKVTGVEFTVEVDWPAIATTAATTGYTDRPGDVIYGSYLSGLTSNLEKLCKDDMCKEAVVEAAHKKVISFSLVADSELEGKYAVCKFSDGTLQVHLSKGGFNCNANRTGSDIQSRL
jgi:hypothetical protein